METKTPGKVHHGRNVRYWRNRRGLSQDQLGDKIEKSQQYIWKQEKKEEIEPEIREELAKALEIPIEAITDFEADMPITFITNKVELNDTAQQSFDSSNGTTNANFHTLNNYYHFYNCTIIPRGDNDDILQKYLKSEKKDDENKKE